MRLERPSPAMIVALLAMFVALGGTGYAALTLPKNSVGAKQLKKKAVTGKKIGKNAVTSPKVKDFSLLAKDFKAGELPAGEKGDQGPVGPTFLATTMGSNAEAPSDPPISPDEASAAAITSGRHFDFSLPAAGQVYVRFFITFWAQNCSSGVAKSGLYLDGAPVPKTAHNLPGTTSTTAHESVVLLATGAGSHSLEILADCSSGNLLGFFIHNVPTWTVLQIGS